MGGILGSLDIYLGLLCSRACKKIAFLQEKQESPPCKGSGMEVVWPSCGSSVDFFKQKTSMCSHWFLVQDPKQQLPAWFWSAAVEGLRLCGRSISSGTHCANMIKNMSFQRPTRACFAVMVNARTPQVVDMNARTSRFAIRLNSRTPQIVVCVNARTLTLCPNP